MEPASPSLMEPEIGKLRWRCRRGMKELDLLLTRYVDQQYRTAPPDHQRAFRELLDAQDPLIYAYCLGQASPPDALVASLVERIISGAVNDR
ncbi:MAG TPA: succinate dehydrogenase assembly factor 2 [Steroidobacteraceae bacterium]|nr:succinate dehydrogenase assembly factor 2 [Steroidobacteraceae bacterium]